MTFQYAKKPQQRPAQAAQPAQEKSHAEVKAERLRIAREAAETARRRRMRIAMVKAGRLSRQELDESERILYDSLEHKAAAEQRPGFFEKLAQGFAKMGLGVLIGSFITATAAQPNTCKGVTNPFLWKMAGVLGGLGVVVLAVAAAVWVYRYFLL